MRTKIKQRYSLRIKNRVTGIWRKQEWQENLVLDSGLTALANAAGTVGIFTAACVGSGTNPTQIASSPVTFTQTGTTITASGSFFTSAMTGALLKYGTGSGGAEVYLTYVDATHATASVSMTQGITVGTVYFVQATQLQTWLYNNDSYNSSGNSSSNSVVSNTLTLTNQREYIFNQKGSPYTIAEIGWGNSGASNPTIFGRAVLGTPETIGVNDFVILTIQLIYTITPATPQNNANFNQIFDQYKGSSTYTATFALELIDFQTVGSNGSTQGAGFWDSNAQKNLEIYVSSYSQNSQIGNSAPTATSYEIYGAGGAVWAQVGGQLPGFSQAILAGSVSTNGEQLYGIGVDSITADVKSNYTGGTPGTLPVGNFPLTTTWQMVWSRQLSN